MINFGDLIVEKFGKIVNFCNETDLTMNKVLHLTYDYRAFMSLRVREARIIANHLGFRYTNMLYMVEENMVLDGMKEILDRWDDELQKCLEKEGWIEDYAPAVYNHCKYLRRYRFNKDIHRAIIIACRVHALQNKLYEFSPKKRWKYGLSKLIERSDAIRFMVEEGKGQPDYLMKIFCQISEGTDYRLKVLDVAKMAYYYVTSL